MRPMTRTGAVLVLAAVSALACAVDHRIPNARLGCIGDQGCPPGYQCVSGGGASVCCLDGKCGDPPPVGGGEPGGAPGTDAAAAGTGGTGAAGGSAGTGGSGGGGPAGAGGSAPLGDDGGPGPDGSVGPADARRDSRLTPSDASVRPVDAPVDRPPPDVQPDVAVDQGPSKPVCAGAACTGTANCVNGFCEDAPASCTALKQALPAAGDGVYWIQVDGHPQRAYCDMTTGAVLCAARGTRAGGQTRDGAGHKFSLVAELQPGEEQCKIWGVRHQDGFPLDKLFATTPPLAFSTCQALGFKGGDDGLTMTCRYGWDGANGYTDCGFGGAARIKWGNSCDCVLVNGQRPRQYTRELGTDPQGRGIFESGVPWNASGTIFGLCRVK
jgi:hypothetical protein